MNKIISALLFSLIVYTAAAQRVYFVYLQTENNQPFFVKLNEKLYSSTASGYLILSKLRDSSYKIGIGFPGNAPKEQPFTITIGQKDQGYLVKDFGEKGWGLFNLQTLAVQMAAPAKPVNPDKTGTGSKDVSEFTDILSKASDDPSLKEKPVTPKPPAEEKKEPVVTAVKEEVKTPPADTTTAPPVVTITAPVTKKENNPVEVKEPPVTAKTDSTAVVAVVKKEEPPARPEQKEPPVTVKPDTAITRTEVVKKEEPPAEPVHKEPVHTDTVALVKPAAVPEEPAKEPGDSPAMTEEYKKSVVTKRSESSTTEGFGLVFWDQYENGATDTIRLLIPNPKTPLVPVVKEEVKEEKKFLDISSDTAGKTAANDPVPVTQPGNVQPVTNSAVKNNCPGVAAESDFLKLRKKMAAANDDEEMLSEARKYFKQKCFTVEQLKNLSTLFLKDAGKYSFFDAGYLYAADAENYGSLQSELKEEYYINRFKAMLRN